MAHNRAADFYNREYEANRYAVADAQIHGAKSVLEKFIKDYGLASRRCLEVGSGRGGFQDAVPDYTGVDIAESVKPLYHKPYYSAGAEALPFEDNQFDAIWTIWVFEHVSAVEKAMEELRRVIKPGGVLLFAPAWNCRPWAANGYAVRPYSDFRSGQKLIKASIPVRNSRLFRAAYVFPRRLIHLIFHKISGAGGGSLRYRKLRPNYEKFWTSDSDAVNDLDPFDVWLWFVSRGDECLSMPKVSQAFCAGSPFLAFRINK